MPTTPPPTSPLQAVFGKPIQLPVAPRHVVQVTRSVSGAAGPSGTGAAAAAGTGTQAGGASTPAGAQGSPTANPTTQPTPTTTTTPGTRPGYAGHALPAGSPETLDFEQTDLVLKDLPEDQFRACIAKTLLEVDDLGLNRAKGKGRAESYLDMVTWDAANRTTYTNDHTGNTSSCGMFIRNVWWLCGARGSNLFDAAYSGGIIAKLLDFEKNAKHAFKADTFLPKVGDMLYLYKQTTNAEGKPVTSQHVFTILELDRTIAMENGKATIRNADGSLADTITFTSVDGGQYDGEGPDGKGTPNVHWGCQGIKKVQRTMKLDNGHWKNLSAGWPSGDGTTGRPVATWISLWQAKDKFTAPWIRPVRKSRA